MTFGVLLIVFAFLLSNLVQLASTFDCLNNLEDVKCTLGSVTPYRFIANYDDAEIKFRDCKAEKIWLIIRHGTRFPSEKILKLFDDLPNLQSEVLNHCKKEKCFMSHEQLANLGKWEANSFSKEQPMVLAEEGQVELIGLAKRYQSRFPTLMTQKYENTTHKFKFTANQRTEESAKYFTIGLFGKRQSEQIQYPEAEHKDQVLRFYKACDKWQKEVDDNLESYKEVREFKGGALVNEMLKNVSQRLGIDANYDTVKTIQSICSFETAWSKKTESPWCPLLTLEEYKIIEFLNDLKYYWIDGYGHSLTAKIACTALTDMFDFIMSKDKFTTSAYFTHSGTLLKLLASLGIAKDNEPLRHNSYHLSKNRLWRTSFIDTFATNVAFISYNCQSGGPSVLVMHQERVVNLPGCPKNVPCPLKIMQDKYPDRKEECDFDELCSISDSS